MSQVYVSLKNHVFNWLESHTSKDSTAVSRILYSPATEDESLKASSQRYLWVFVSTLGELNAISHLLDELLELYQLHMVLLTDHPHYLDAYSRRYPDAVIINHGNSALTIDTFMDRYPPDLFVISEIPLQLYDAPCRLSFKVVLEASRRKAVIALVNGWRYKGEPSCRMDKLEYSFFNRHYLNVIDLFLLQSEDDREILLRDGADSRKIYVTGNLKFDRLSLETPDIKHIKKEICADDRLTIVAGCVTNLSEQALLLDSYLIILKQHPDALLILAPRHPENADRMTALKNMLQERNLHYALRSDQNVPIDLDTSVLVLNTMGELEHFYAIGDVCYVGLNHNILEPLNFLKPTVVTPGWEPSYPSYPVYNTLLKKGLVYECPDSEAESLAETINAVISEPSERHQTMIHERLSHLFGAQKKAIELIDHIYPRSGRPKMTTNTM